MRQECGGKRWGSKSCWAPRTMSSKWISAAAAAICARAVCRITKRWTPGVHSEIAICRQKGRRRAGISMRESPSPSFLALSRAIYSLLDRGGGRSPRRLAAKATIAYYTCMRVRLSPKHSCFKGDSLLLHAGQAKKKMSVKVINHYMGAFVLFF